LIGINRLAINYSGGQMPGRHAVLQAANAKIAE